MAPRSRMTRAAVVALALAAPVVLGTALHGQSTADTRWVTAWATSQQALGDTSISNATVRMIARPTIAGRRVRLRIDNAFGRAPLTLARTFVGYRVRGALVAAGTSVPVSFEGRPQVSVPAGGTVLSDPVELPVLAQQDLAITFHVPGAALRPSQHTSALVTSYRTPDGAGDVTAVEDATPFTQTTTSSWWLKAVEVDAPADAAALVAFGDSITDGTCSTLDAHNRWEDLLAVRLAMAQRSAREGTPQAGPLAVVNEGIGGNTLTRTGLVPAPDSPPALERIDRDVLTHHGVSSVILFMGTNDIRRGASASQVIDAMTSIAQKVKAAGLRAIGVTIIPRHNAGAGSATPWDASKTRIRNEVNAWIRGRAPFDAVLDFSKVVQDGSDADRLKPAFDCGDGIHPSPLGYFEMGMAVDLGVLRQP